MRRDRTELRTTSEIARTVIPGNKRIESAVMAGLGPAIHVFAARRKVVDARHKAGHDGVKTHPVIAGLDPAIGCLPLICF
jgi:hypothetical protein